MHKIIIKAIFLTSSYTDKLQTKGALNIAFKNSKGDERSHAIKMYQPNTINISEYRWDKNLGSFSRIFKRKSFSITRSRKK
jgi:hypothetical protein